MDLSRGYHQPIIFCGGGYWKASSSDVFSYRLSVRPGRNGLENRRAVCAVYTRENATKTHFPVRNHFRKTLATTNACISLRLYSSHKFLGCLFENSRCSGLTLRSHSNDSLPFIVDSDKNVPAKNSRGSYPTPVILNESEPEIGTEESKISNAGEGKMVEHSLDVHRELLQEETMELKAARLNSNVFEEKAQKISEVAEDDASRACERGRSTLEIIKGIANEESAAKAAVERAIMALSLAEARARIALEFPRSVGESKDSSETSSLSKPESLAVGSTEAKAEGSLLAWNEINSFKGNIEFCEMKLQQYRCKKAELENILGDLNTDAEKVQVDALNADEEVANIILLAERAVAFEVEAAQKVSDAKLALRESERSISSFFIEKSEALQAQVSSGGAPTVEQCKIECYDGAAPVDSVSTDVKDHRNFGGIGADSENFSALSYRKVIEKEETTPQGSSNLDEVDTQKFKSVHETKKFEVQRGSFTDSTKPTILLKKSSRFFPTSLFSFTVNGHYASVFHDLLEFAKGHLPTLIFGLMLLGSGITIYTTKSQDIQGIHKHDIFAASEDDLSTSKPFFRHIVKFPNHLKKFIEKLSSQKLNEEEISHFDMLWLLLASVIFVPIFQKIPGGSPVLGYLAAGILIGPFGLSIIHHVHGTKAIAEFGVIFLLFNIGLELSVERLLSMKTYVFGLGSIQVLATSAMIGSALHFIWGHTGPTAIVIGSGLALSSTAVVLQVLQERGESTSCHGCAAFSVLLFQDLAVVVLLILVPLLSPNSSEGGGIGLVAIARALGLAGIRALAAIAGIIAGGRLLLRPVYRKIAATRNAEIFSANTLLVILGTSLLTAKAGLSMALGAFLAGLLLGETEFSLQVESDIAPYRGLLLGLFFVTVGMSIDPKLLISNFSQVMKALAALIAVKAALVVLAGKMFGLSLVSAVRVGLLLAPGGEFAFVAFGEAVNHGIMASQLSSLMFIVVGMSMALTPWLAAGGQLIASRFELRDVRDLVPCGNEAGDLQDHIIICGFGRVGQIIAQLLYERLIPFVALDVTTERVAAGRSLDIPVYFGDSGSREVLHKIGAGRACAAVVALDSPGSNYRTVQALNKYFPDVKTFVRAHDVNHGLSLARAGATAVVPEVLEPSLQLAAAVLAQTKLPRSEIAATIGAFRNRHLAGLSALHEANGSSLGDLVSQSGYSVPLA